MKKINIKVCLSIIFILSINSLQSEDWYKYKTSILEDATNQTKKIDPRVENIAKVPNVYGFLNSSEFFDKNKIVNYELMNKKFKTQTRDSLFLEVPIKTIDNEKILLSFFKRHKNQKDIAILVGPGFTNPAERMAPFVHIFQNYDVAILNYRGHGLTPPPVYKLANWLAHKTFQVSEPTKVGAIEQNDVFAAVKFLRAQGYKKIIGMGICYSSLIFLKSQAMHYEKTKEQLFDKLILDSPWISLEAFCEKLGSDPMLIFTPQRGGWKDKWLCKKGYFQWFFPFLIKAFTDEGISGKSILPYLKHIVDVPLLMWYGKDDLTVARDEFEQIWHGITNTRKTAIITSNPHVINHIKQKELYALVNNLFIETDSYNEFLKSLAEPELLRDIIIKNKHYSLTRTINAK